MSYERFQSLKVRIERRMACVTIDHPLINLLDKTPMLEFHDLGKALAQDDGMTKVVVQSANSGVLHRPHGPDPDGGAGA
jgi:hypothetical protein